MPDIVLTTLNARYSHTAFGLRYLMANLGELRSGAALREFDMQSPVDDMCDTLLQESPRIIGIGVYIWNAKKVSELIDILRERSPEVRIVLGGPEVSFEAEELDICRKADFVICGEGDIAFAACCRQILDGAEPSGKMIQAEPPPLSDLCLPYDLYSDKDIENRVIYVEASRGCPFHCEYCLSSMDDIVRRFEPDRLSPEFERLVDRGVQHFKFVDRTFNLHIDFCCTVLDFFMARYRPGLFLHFEMIPDRMPDALAGTLKKFPRGSLQLELGIQTFNKIVADRIQRRQKNDIIETNMRFLRNETNAYIHADLIAGLPGEDLSSFAEGFDRLAALNPHEIQVGILKKLRGTPIARHDAEWSMSYNPEPPYNLISNNLMTAEDMEQVDAFGQLWDKICNSGNFVETAPLLWRDSDSVFDSFMRWTDWFTREAGASHSIPLPNLCSLLLTYLTSETGVPATTVCEPMLRDYQRGRRRGAPACLRPFFDRVPQYQFDHPSLPPGMKRQARHLAPLRS